MRGGDHANVKVKSAKISKRRGSFVVIPSSFLFEYRYSKFPKNLVFLEEGGRTSQKKSFTFSSFRRNQLARATVEDLRTPKVRLFGAALTSYPWTCIEAFG